MTDDSYDLRSLTEKEVKKEISFLKAKINYLHAVIGNISLLIRTVYTQDLRSSDKESISKAIQLTEIYGLYIGHLDHLVEYYDDFMLKKMKMMEMIKD